MCISYIVKFWWAALAGDVRRNEGAAWGLQELHFVSDSNYDGANCLIRGIVIESCDHYGARKLFEQPGGLISVGPNYRTWAKETALLIQVGCSSDTRSVCFSLLLTFNSSILSTVSFLLLLFPIIYSFPVFFFNLPTHHCSFFSFLSADLNASLEICKSFWRHTAVWTMGGSFCECSNTNSTNLAFHLSSDLRLLMSIYPYYYLQKGLTTIRWSYACSSHPSSMAVCFRSVGRNYQQNLCNCHEHFGPTASVWCVWGVFARCARNVGVIMETYVSLLYSPEPATYLFLSQINPVHALSSYFLKDSLNNVLPPTARSSKWAPSFMNAHQSPVTTSRATCPPHLILLNVIT